MIYINAFKHLIVGVYIEINGNIFETQKRKIKYSSEKEVFLSPIKKDELLQIDNTENCKKDIKSDKKAHHTTDIYDPRID